MEAPLGVRTFPIVEKSSIAALLLTFVRGGALRTAVVLSRVTWYTVMQQVPVQKSSAVPALTVGHGARGTCEALVQQRTGDLEGAGCAAC